MKEKVLVIILFVILCSIIGYMSYNLGIKNIPGPIIKYDTIDYNKNILDSLSNAEDSIIFKIKYIDSIRIKEIYEKDTISDSAAVMLFYELISKE